MTKEYQIKGSAQGQNLMKILKEKKDGYDIIITRYKDDFKTEEKEFISKQLFETCLRTHYIQAVNA